MTIKVNLTNLVFLSIYYIQTCLEYWTSSTSFTFKMGALSSTLYLHYNSTIYKFKNFNFLFFENAAKELKEL